MISNLITTSIVEFMFVFAAWYAVVVTSQQQTNATLVLIGMLSLVPFALSLVVTSVGISAYLKKQRIPSPNKYILITKFALDMVVLAVILWLVGLGGS
jgi:hypothetical protein